MSARLDVTGATHDPLDTEARAWYDGGMNTNPTSPADHQAAEAALAGLPSGWMDEPISIRRGDLIELLQTSLLPSECDDDDWDDPEAAAWSRQAEAALVQASEIGLLAWSPRTT